VVTSQVVHIAGAVVQVGPLVRQRCSWCGAVLLDDDLRGMAAAFEVNTPCARGHRPCSRVDPECVGQDATPGSWPVGELVSVSGSASSVIVRAVVAHEDGAQLPADACASLDPDVTR